MFILLIPSTQASPSFPPPTSKLTTGTLRLGELGAPAASSLARQTPVADVNSSQPKVEEEVDVEGGRRERDVREGTAEGADPYELTEEARERAGEELSFLLP